MCQSSRIALLVLVCILSLSMFVSKISNIITVNTRELSPVPESLRTAEIPSMVLGSSSDHLMWFVQISDIHISIFHDPGRIDHLWQFCNTTINAIRPAVVLASGDLTDGKALDTMGSDQYIQEWEHYKAVLEETKVVEKTVWLDIRGNHDNFNVPGVSSQRSFFHRFSVQGRKHKRSYMYTLKSDSETYSFIAVDACLEPGPRRPFNFIGSLTDDQFELLENFEIESRKSNGTVWFGHYPTSCIVSPNPGIRHLMRNGVAYLCGHLHTLGNFVKNMYTMQHSGILELELGDWKDNRIYRVAAFDHGLFSFTDVAHESWPVILITNPKNALFILQEKEPLNLMKFSTHIRIIVFSPNPIEKVRVNLDESADWLECENINGPLYVTKWDPVLYSSGLHNIRVYARDAMGQSSEISQTFSLDGTKMSFQLLPRLALMTDAKQVFRGVFVALVILSVFPLLTLRFLHMLVRAKKLEKPDVEAIFCSKFLRRMWILSTINKLFVPIIGYPIYLLIGPWFIGEVIEGHIGATFAWGTVVSWTILPTAFTYFYGIVQLFWFHIPLIIILCYSVDHRFKEICFGDKISSRFLSHVPCGCVLLVQALFAYYFWLAYGTIAFILGPLRTWSVLMGIYLWYSSVTLSRQNFAEACLTWSRNDYPECKNGTLLQSSHNL